MVSAQVTAESIIGSCVVAMTVAACAAAGVYIPLRCDSPASKAVVKWAHVVEGLASGAMLALAMVHLLPSAQQQLGPLSAYPIANTALIVGFFLMTLSQMLAPRRLHAHRPSANKLGFHLMEVSIAVHSVMIGIAVGFSQSGWRELVGLGAALSAHQFLEGFIIGTLAKRNLLREGESVRTLVVFSLTLPLGVIIASVFQSVSNDTDFQDGVGYRWASGLLNALAAGTLTQLAAEMAGSEHFESENEHELLVPAEEEAVPCGPGLQWLPKLLAFGLGALLMGALAIWADGPAQRTAAQHAF